MHRGVREQLEDILADAGGARADAGGAEHLSECQECNEEVAAMREQRRLFRSLKTGPEGSVEPSAGFYARVMERIEAQGVVSIWQLFFDSRVGRRLAMASMVVAVSLGVYLVSAEENAAPDRSEVVTQGALHGSMLTGSPDANAVLMNLVTYREQ
jgi:hypothetical protein